MEAYKTHLQIWHFNSQIASNRISNFMTFTTIIITIMSGLFVFGLGNMDYYRVIFLFYIIMSIFAFMVSFFWYSMIMRTQAYNQYCKRKCEEIQSEIQQKYHMIEFLKKKSELKKEPEFKKKFIRTEAFYYIDRFLQTILYFYVFVFFISLALFLFYDHIPFFFN
ncbi:MAG: RipA family octameric membrane protein [Candidatus Hodarchaeales archaeon]